MKSRQFLVVVGLAFVLWGAGHFATAGFAAEPTARPKSSTASRRLPNCFARLGLSDDQRQTVYETQARYRGEIDRLEEELARVKREQDEAIEAVLTDSQRTQLNQHRSDAKSKRSGASVSASTTSSSSTPSSTAIRTAVPAKK
jgi:Spy/CpxP family protein refolding chaperone